MPRIKNKKGQTNSSIERKNAFRLVLKTADGPLKGENVTKSARRESFIRIMSPIMH